MATKLNAVTAGDERQLQRPRGAKRDIRQLLEDGRTQALMKQLATKHLSPDRLTRLAVIACNKTPKLLECDPQTLLGAFLGCSALGLEPNTPLQHLHLIPYKSSVQAIVGYRGYLELGRRSGLIAGMHADIVYPGDLFEHQYGTETYLRHQSKDWGGEVTDYTHAYCFVHLKDGQAFTVMPKSAILRIRNQSQGYQNAKQANKLASNPWVAHEARMARKTPIRQLFGGGEVPLSLEMAGAVSIDEAKVDFSALTHASAEEIKEGMGSFVDHDDEREQQQPPVREEEEDGNNDRFDERHDEEDAADERVAERAAAEPKEEPRQGAPRGRRDAETDTDRMFR